MIASSGSTKGQVVRSDWYKGLSQFEKPHLGRALWQVFNTVIPFGCLMAVMVWMVQAGITYWLVLPLVFLAAGLLVRVFIFFHDCCHGSFFASHCANQIMGFIFGVLVFTPFDDWRTNHAGHHATTGNLDKRGIGDVETWTVAEYNAAPKLKRFIYRITRNPLVLFLLAGPVIFLILYRFPKRGANARVRNSVALTNLAISAIIATAVFTIGLRTYLLVQLPVIGLASAIGVWMFYVQHQFEGVVYWEHHKEWDPIRAALEGSSYYKLPGLLQWFSGNIGLHHIHHLRPKIPNYNLQHCFDQTPALQEVAPITLGRSFRCMFLNLWDESSRRLISFRTMKRKRRQEQILAAVNDLPARELLPGPSRD